jgi:hypothetical protein
MRRAFEKHRTTTDVVVPPIVPGVEGQTDPAASAVASLWRHPHLQHITLT